MGHEWIGLYSNGSPSYQKRLKTRWVMLRKLSWAIVNEAVKPPNIHLTT